MKSADRALEVIEVLCKQEGLLTLAELSRLLGVPRSSLHAILRTMRQRGWVECDATGRRFGLGLRAVSAASSYLDADPVVLACSSVLDALASATGETVHLGRLDAPDIVFLAKRESPEPVRLFSAVGRRLPAHASALGKAILATRPAREVEALVTSPLVRLTARTIADLSALHAELALIRERGYATDDQENSEGVRCFAMALPVGRVVRNALSVSVPVFRQRPQTEAQAVEALRRAVGSPDPEVFLS